ncbi:DNA endonuclease RBBP8 isoform X1 [Dicentrarchus labrax]|uniref:DNA endonuclease RBBP8 n=1 Tax=Dicentrarchus labrax TaxID=13489 RepID=A0A8C4IEN6_DICLA|nr:DNA endonuclease RBBP8 isoform X1 [Dicentrarchus labrax]XP_051267102.1 DNA endonuclease RBBP8 isoform X1 [Dicentrarchus labrax]XP_051267103.1 DNA endonuclease RBBP8 isoform X1 [Dicentrarchus labrax]XP_051267104.1 DNA endonuclease RBBP8 isoform X1 [Dicentrarchus labrax]
MSSPGLSSGTPKAADLFEGLWRQLGECHQNALRELEAKVGKLKKERCLDAQSLEVFHNRNQQLKEQNKTLQHALSLLEERLRGGECDRCAVLEENLKNNQDQSLRLIAKLKNERNSLEDENIKLHAELQKLKMSRSELQQPSSPEQEEGFIPDSPILPSSLPVVNKLKKRRNIDKIKRVRYAEIALPQSNNSLFSELNKEPVGATKNPGRAEVLVPNTCELDAFQISNDANQNLEEEVAETCGLELLEKPHMKTETSRSTGQQSRSKSPWKNDVHLKPYCSSLSSTLIHSPDSTTERSPSLLPRVKRFSEESSFNKAKRKKEESEEEDKQGNQEGVDKETEGKHIQPELIKRTSTPLNNQSFKKEPLHIKVQSAQNDTANQRPNVSCISPAFKKPNVRREANKGGVGKRGNPLQDLSASHDQHEGEDDHAAHPAQRKPRVEPMWSIDPALALSMYDSEWRGDEQNEDQQCHGELVDTDCTWVSHSLLQSRAENAPDRRDSVSGLGGKANDSLDMMFDTTAYGEYKSCNGSHLGHSQPCDDEDDDEEEEEEEEGNEPHENTMSQSRGHKARRPTFAHVAVIRNKEERRKLQGTTCKECEIYYAHLPEEERQKKLSSCSRHRFLYIPPSTPENFWEVGFPSTQTCIERGYIKEEKNPQARSRRRQPFNALFSPNKKQQED